MGSMKSQSQRYEVLVYPQNPIIQTKKVMSSSNSVQPFLFQTEIQRFQFDGENMQQYWIPEGYHPVLVPRTLMQSHISPNSRQTAAFSVGNDSSNVNFCQLRQRNTSPVKTFGGNEKHRRYSTLGSQKDHMKTSPSPPTSKVPLITFYAAALYYKQKCKELTASGVISNPPSEPPSKIIGRMWYEEPESTRKHYERLAQRLKTLKYEYENDSNKRLGRRQPIYKHPNIRHNTSLRVARKKLYHRQPNEQSTKNVLNLNNTNESNVFITSSEDFTQNHVLRKTVSSYRRSSNNKNDYNIEGGNFDSTDKSFAEHQYSIMTSADDPRRESFINSSSPKLIATQINNDNVNDALNADWMKRSNDEDDLCDSNDTDY